MTPSVLVIERSTNGVRSSLSVDVLSERPTSSTPAGGATGPALTQAPVSAARRGPVRVWTGPPAAAASTAAASVYATGAPDARSAVVAIPPAPDPAAHAPPLLPTHVQVALVSAPGRASVIAAPVTVDGPELVTRIE